MTRTSLAIFLAAVVLSVRVATAQSQPGSVHDHDSAHRTTAASEPTPEVAEFIARARAAGERYASRRTAISDGYRRLGPDFPTMGEHWIQPGRMVLGEIDADRPQALSYVTIDGQPVLTGVIYAKPLQPGEPAPDFPPGAYAWHDHSGTIDEESVLLGHTLGGGADGSGVRLAMMHIWLWPDNARGLFEAENWALPFVRLHLGVPEQFTQGAARALSLASGGADYYLLLFDMLANPSPADAATAERLVAATRAAIEEWLSLRDPTSTLTMSELEMLDTRWTRLWTEIAAHINPDAGRALHPILLQ